MAAQSPLLVASAAANMSAQCLPVSTAFVGRLAAAEYAQGSAGSRIEASSLIAAKRAAQGLELSAFSRGRLRGQGFSHREQSRRRIVEATASPNFLQRLGRVIKEKARADIDRVNGLMTGMSKTRQQLAVVDELFTYWKLNETDQMLEELEEVLLVSDFGPSTTIKIVEKIRGDILSGKVKRGSDIKGVLKKTIVELLRIPEASVELQLANKPSVIMIVGVNGGGKTTTIGKIARMLTEDGASVAVAAGDTFRAAAVEQLQTWAERSGATFYSGNSNAKPAGVLYDAVTKARAKESNIDVLICDTSGRLHTNDQLMEELAKCKRSIMKAQNDQEPDEVLLVLDGTTGLNMLNQAREFKSKVGVTGIILTKLDGTARGGCVVSVVDELRIPVKFVGVGEKLSDLQPFDPDTFVDALFS